MRPAINPSLLSHPARCAASRCRWYHKALEAEPDNVAALNGLGFVHFNGADDTPGKALHAVLQCTTCLRAFNSSSMQSTATCYAARTRTHPNAVVALTHNKRPQSTRPRPSRTSSALLPPANLRTPFSMPVSTHRDACIQTRQRNMHSHSIQINMHI